MGPEVDDTEEGEVDGDPIDESADDAGRADILRDWVFSEL